MRVPFSNIALKTGSSAPGDALLFSLEQPHVLDCDNRLVSERSHQLDLFFGIWARLQARQNDDADRRTVAEQRYSQHRPKGRGFLTIAELIIRVGKDIGYVDGAACRQDAAGQRAAAGPDGHFTYKIYERLREPVVRRQYEMVALRPNDCGHVRLAQKRCGLGESVEHELQIERGTAYCLEHVGRCSLLLQRLTQFVEQPGVLDGDDRLGGEVLQQLDLFIGERLDFDSSNRDDADDLVYPQHRHRKDGPMHLLIIVVIVGPPILGICLDIVNVDNATLQNGSSRRRASILTDRVLIHIFFMNCAVWP